METFTPVSMSTEEWFSLCRSLERHHSVFYALWQMGKPVFTTRVPTAAIGFVKGSPIEFAINPGFWASRTPAQREFILCHEMLHILLNHGMRGRDSKNRDAANVAMDVVVNHTLVDHFDFKREDVDPENKFCWMDTVFSKHVKANETFEYYYNKLDTCKGPKTKVILVDDHGGLYTCEDGILTETDINDIAKDLSPEQAQQLKDALEKDAESRGEGGDEGGQEAGSQAGKLWKIMSDVGVKAKRKWETVIKRWADPFMPREDRTTEHWLRTNRRLSLIPDSALLPTEMEEEDKPDLGKVDVLLLLDTSGSCAHLAERFWKAGRSLPKSRFNVTMACFDTRVYPVDMEKKQLFGFGGTYFHILEGYAKGMEKYPTAVFVITDGYGNLISPSFPKRWHWFLTSRYTNCIPKECHTYQLTDYE
jgi:predicted metal-dependent peptidase